MRSRVSSRLPQRSTLTASGYSNSRSMVTKPSSAAMAPIRWPTRPSSRPRSNRPRNSTASRSTPPVASSMASIRAAGPRTPSSRNSRNNSRPGRLGGSARAATSSGDSGAGLGWPAEAIFRPLACTRTAPHSSSCPSTLGAGFTDQ